MQDNFDTLTILSGQADSTTLALDSAMHAAGILLPVGWTAANLSFRVSHDTADAGFVGAVDATGTEITVTGTVNRWIMLSPGLLFGARYLKIRSGTNASPVNQAADRAIQVALRRYT